LSIFFPDNKYLDIFVLITVIWFFFDNLDYIFYQAFRFTCYAVLFYFIFHNIWWSNMHDLQFPITKYTFGLKCLHFFYVMLKCCALTFVTDIKRRTSVCVLFPVTLGHESVLTVSNKFFILVGQSNSKTKTSGDIFLLFMLLVSTCLKLFGCTLLLTYVLTFILKSNIEPMLKQKPHWYFEGSTILPLGEQ
jgi:hypothetical protein